MNRDNKKNHFDNHNHKTKTASDNKVIDDISVSPEKENAQSKEIEYLEMAQRIKAEFENYKKRNADLSIQSFNNGVISVVSKLLPALDGFQKAKEIIKDEDVLSGVQMIESQIVKVLTDLGVSKIEAVGKEFDPNYHNAVLTGCDSNYADNIVLEELQSGYMLNDKVIRYSVVRVNKL